MVIFARLVQVVVAATSLANALRHCCDRHIFYFALSGSLDFVALNDCYEGRLAVVALNDCYGERLTVVALNDYYGLSESADGPFART